VESASEAPLQSSHEFGVSQGPPGSLALPQDPPFLFAHLAEQQPASVAGHCRAG
jgi:hypothetical protein